MNFKVNKDELLNQIHCNVNVRVGNDLYRLTGGNEITMYELRDIIKNAITSGVEEGFSTMLENRYTDEDFENDVGLR